ncbi:MAG: GNAT family N-acetyltransferase, partial [Bradyrhizobium sp.]
MTAYAFRPMSTDDLPTIRRWLETPHVSEWWHDPAEQFEIVSGDLDHPDMAQFIVAADGQEFAYLQCYNLSAWDSGFGSQPDGTRGLDQFIGEQHARMWSWLGVRACVCRRIVGFRNAPCRDRSRSRQHTGDQGL